MDCFRVSMSSALVFKIFNGFSIVFAFGFFTSLVLSLFFFLFNFIIDLMREQNLNSDILGQRQTLTVISEIRVINWLRPIVCHKSKMLNPKTMTMTTAASTALPCQK